jgi:hypothetical protein
MKPYTRDSLMYALTRHGARFTSGGESLQRPWTIQTAIGPLSLSSAECHAYVCGLAEMRLELAQDQGSEHFSASVTRRWLAELDQRAGADVVGVARELANALAKAGFEALAQAVSPPATASDAAHRYGNWYAVVGFDVDAVLDLRPDLTTAQADQFLARYDGLLADSLAAHSNEILAGCLADIADEIPTAPSQEVLEELIEARQLARAEGRSHNPGRLYWQLLDEVLAGCSECGACDLAAAADPHQCRLSDAYYHIVDGTVLCAGCFAKAQAAAGSEEA